MEVVFLSSDDELQRECRDLLGEILGTGWGFTACDPYTDALPAADLYIWEHSPKRSLPEEHLIERQKHLIVLQRKHLPLLREQGFPEVNLILKPYTRAALRTFLEQACARWKEQQENPGARIQALRADRDELLLCLLQSNLRLQEYDQDRTNFLARAIHDFRAPLTALSGYCGLLLGEQLGPLTRDQQEVVRRMHNSARRLTRMAEAMFQLGIWQRVEQEPVFRREDIRECIEQALHEVQPFIDEKRITVTVNVEPVPEGLAFERGQIEQVLINLLDNACKFTPRAGRVHIQAYPYFWDRRRSRAQDGFADRRSQDIREPNAVRVDIRDTGPGIPVSQLERVFEEYTTYSGGQDRSGGGLGLSICKMILSRHHGRVWAENGPEGAVFSFVLPLHQPEPIMPAVDNATQAHYTRIT